MATVIAIAASFGRRDRRFGPVGLGLAPEQVVIWKAYLAKECRRRHSRTQPRQASAGRYR